MKGCACDVPVFAAGMDSPSRGALRPRFELAPAFARAGPRLREGKPQRGLPSENPRGWSAGRRVQPTTRHAHISLRNVRKPTCASAGTRHHAARSPLGAPSRHSPETSSLRLSVGPRFSERLAPLLLASSSRPARSGRRAEPRRRPGARLRAVPAGAAPNPIFGTSPEDAPR